MLVRFVPIFALFVALVAAVPGFGHASRLLKQDLDEKDVFAYRLYEEHVPTSMQRGLYNDWLSHPQVKDNLEGLSNEEVALQYLSDVTTAVSSIHPHNLPPAVWERSEYAQVFQFLHERFKNELETHWEDHTKEQLWKMRLASLKKSRRTKNKFRKQGE